MVGLHFRYEEEEFVAATRLYLLRKPALLARFGLVFILVMAGICLLLAALAALPTTILTAAVVAAPILLYSLLYEEPRKAFRRDPRNKEEFYWQFSEQGITQRTLHTEAHINWELFTHVLAGRRFYLLAYGKHMFTLIPRRAFATPAQEAAFVALLRHKVAPDFNAKFLPADQPHALDGYTPPVAPPDWR